MINDTTSTFKSLVLINPYSHVDKGMKKSLVSLVESIKKDGNNLVLLDHILHSSELMANIVEVTMNELRMTDGVGKPKKWEWSTSGREKMRICQGIL